MARVAKWEEQKVAKLRSRKRGRQQSSDESSSSSEDEDTTSRGRNGRKGASKKSSKKSQSTGHGYFESDNNDSQVEVVEEDGEVLPSSHPLRRKERDELNKRGQMSSAAEESGVTDLGEDIDEWAEQTPLDINAVNMRKQLGYFDGDDYDDE